MIDGKVKFQLETYLHGVMTAESIAHMKSIPEIQRFATNFLQVHDSILQKYNGRMTTEVSIKVMSSLLEYAVSAMTEPCSLIDEIRSELHYIETSVGASSNVYDYLLRLREIAVDEEN